MRAVWSQEVASFHVDRFVLRVSRGPRLSASMGAQFPNTRILVADGFHWEFAAGLRDFLRLPVGFAGRRGEGYSWRELA